MIGIFREIVGQARTSLKPGLNYKEIKDAVNSRVKGRQEFDESLPIMDVDVFIKRYKNVRFSAFAAGILALVSLISIAFSANVHGFMLSLTSFMVLTLFYVKLSFLLWASREAAFSPEIRVVKLPDFMTAISKDPNQFLPLSLAHKVGK